MKTIMLLATACVAASSFATDVYVHPHYTANGTFVQGYFRTAPDHTIQNNYSTQGNINPYNGQAGTVNPYYQPPQPIYQPPPQPTYIQPAPLYQPTYQPPCNPYLRRC